MTYAEWVSALEDLLLYQNNGSSDYANFTAILPRAIEYAENRIYREVDFLATRTSDTSTITVIGTKTVSVPSTFQVIDSVNVLTPAGSSVGTATRNPLTAVSKDFITNYWPSSTTGMPQYYSTYTYSTNYLYVLAPTPDAAYNIEFVGVSQPAALSVSNTSTLLTTLVPDLFLAASMAFMTGYQRDYGAQSDDPQQANSWERQYQTLLASVLSVDGRRKIEASSWSSRAPSVAANEQRG